MIPVAITRAKYPGNRSATARERRFGGLELFIRGRFFIASLAVELQTNVCGTTFSGHDPRAIGHWWIVADVLSMAAGQDGAPMILVVLIEACDLLFH